MTDDGLHRCAYCGAGFADLDSVLEHQDSCDDAPDYLRAREVFALRQGNWRPFKPYVEIRKFPGKEG